MDQIKVIATDIDNTLVSGEKLSELNRSAVDELEKKGLFFIPVTGRSPKSGKNILESNGIKSLPSAFHHGAIIFNAKGEQIVDMQIEEKNQIMVKIAKGCEDKLEPGTATLLVQGAEKRYIFELTKNSNNQCQYTQNDQAVLEGLKVDGIINEIDPDFNVYQISAFVPVHKRNKEEQLEACKLVDQIFNEVVS